MCYPYNFIDLPKEYEPKHEVNNINILILIIIIMKHVLDIQREYFIYAQQYKTDKANKKWEKQEKTSTLGSLYVKS